MENRSDEQWMGEWLNSVCEARVSMSQRTKKSIQDHGGIEAAVEAAKARHVHLALLTDEHGRELVIASLFPFEVLC